MIPNSLIKILDFLLLYRAAQVDPAVKSVQLSNHVF